MPDPVAGFTPAIHGVKVIPVDETTINLVATVGPASTNAGAPNWAAIIAAVVQALPAIMALIQAFLPTPAPAPAPNK